MNAPMTLPGVESNAISHNLCMACGLCALNCPTQALQMAEQPLSDAQIRKNPVFSPHLCVHCGRCAAVCPTGTIFQYRMEQLLHQVQDEGIQTMVFFCEGLNRSVHSPHALGQIPPELPLQDSRKIPFLQEGLRVPPGCLLETVRCTGRLGARFLLRLALQGVRRIVLFACPPPCCDYAHGRPGVSAQVEALQALLQEYGLAPLQISLFQEGQPSRDWLQQKIEEAGL